MGSEHSFKNMVHLNIFAEWIHLIDEYFQTIYFIVICKFSSVFLFISQVSSSFHSLFILIFSSFHPHFRSHMMFMCAQAISGFPLCCFSSVVLHVQWWWPWGPPLLRWLPQLQSLWLYRLLGLFENLQWNGSTLKIYMYTELVFSSVFI